MNRLPLIASIAAHMLLMTACGPDPVGAGCKDKLIAGDLVITEVFADYAPADGGSGVDEGKEWFEIYNASDKPLELQGMTITHSRPDGSKDKSHQMDPFTIAPGSFAVLGNATEDLLPAYVDYGYSADLGEFFNTDGGMLALKCGTSEIDSAQYASVKSGHSRQLSSAQPPDYTANDDLAMWCQADDAEFETKNFGTPGEDSDCAPVVLGQCNDGGTMRDAIAPGVGDLVITEMMPKPTTSVGAANGQWFEAKVLKDLDLNGVGLDRANDTANPVVIESADCLHVSAGEYVTFARASLDPSMNGGVMAKAAFGFSINPTTTMPDVQLVYGATVIDAVTWTTSTTGKSLSLDPQFTDASANDNVVNFCDGTAQYEATGPNLGTPDAVNTSCPMVAPSGMCIQSGTPRPIVKPTVGQLVITETLPRPADTGMPGVTADEWVEVTNTGAASFDLNELFVKGTGNTNQILTSDCVTVAPGAFVVLAHSNNPMTNGGLPAVAATFALTISSEFSILDTDGVTVIDLAKWGTVTINVSRELKQGMTTSTANDTTANWCNADVAQTYGTGGHLGTPGAANVCP